MRIGHVTRIVNAVVPNPFPRESKIRYAAAPISRLLKIIGLFANEPYKRDYILEKRPIILRSLLIVATP